MKIIYGFYLYEITSGMLVPDIKIVGGIVQLLDKNLTEERTYEKWKENEKQIFASNRNYIRVYIQLYNSNNVEKFVGKINVTFSYMKVLLCFGFNICNNSTAAW